MLYKIWSWRNEKSDIEYGLELFLSSNGNDTIFKRYHTNNIFGGQDARLNVFGGQDGQLVDLADISSIKINLGIFPFLKVVNSNNDNDYNDFYKVAFFSQDFNRKYSNVDYELKFGKNGRILENTGII